MSEQKLSERMRQDNQWLYSDLVVELETQLAEAIREHDAEIVQMAREVTAMRNERDQAIRERDEARSTVQELRAINVEPGISLGVARDWKSKRDALAKALEDQVCAEPCKHEDCRDNLVLLATLERSAPADGGTK